MRFRNILAGIADGVFATVWVTIALATFTVAALVLAEIARAVFS